MRDSKLISIPQILQLLIMATMAISLLACTQLYTILQIQVIVGHDTSLILIIALLAAFAQWA